MTLKQAEKRAYKLWGAKWMIADREWANDPFDRYAVGYSAGGLFMIRGKGPTWEAAFTSVTDAPVAP